MIDESTKPRAGLSERARWLLHFLILCCPILLTVLIFLVGHHPKLPENYFQLAKFISLELLAWGVFFAAAFRASRITARQLGLVTSSPVRTICYGIGWFFVIRISIMIIFMFQARWIDPRMLWVTQEKLLDFTRARDIPLHPAFSFAVFGIAALIAGFSEELWRVGMLRGLGGIFPHLVGKRAGTFASILFVSVIFGLAHLYQGWFGVENAVLLGILLGLILIYRRSYWEIAIAHTLFDVSAFGAIALVMLNPSLFDSQIVYSAYHGDIPKINYLVAMGGNVNATFSSRRISALEEAAQQPNPEMLNVLLEKGANPNLADSYGMTPLIAAINRNQLQNIKVLIDHGANVNLADKRGETPLAAARRLGYVDSANLLLQNGGR